MVRRSLYHLITCHHKFRFSGVQICYSYRHNCINWNLKSETVNCELINTIWTLTLLSYFIYNIIYTTVIHGISFSQVKSSLSSPSSPSPSPYLTWPSALSLTRALTSYFFTKAFEKAPSATSTEIWYLTLAAKGDNLQMLNATTLFMCLWNRKHMLLAQKDCWLLTLLFLTQNWDS